MPVTETTPNRWRGVPRDERQAERRRLLVAAGFDLLGTVGVSGTTVRGVCERARLNPRYFYESFGDLDELLVAVFNRTAEEGLAVILAAVRNVDESDTLAVTRAGMGSFLRYATDDPRRAQVLFVEGLGNEALSRRRLGAMLELADLFERGAAEKAQRRLAADQAGGAAVDPVVKVAASLVVGGMSELMITWLHGHLELSLDQLIADTSVLFVAIGEAADALAASRALRPPG